MVRAVRLWRGEWRKNQAEEWDFVTHPEDFGFRMMLSRTASFEGLDNIIRRRYCLSPHTPVVVTYRMPEKLLVPLGNKTPPTTISNTPQLSMLLNVRTWLDELAILVTMGARDVAAYQFLCRTNFVIGATAYVFDAFVTENSRAAYQSLVFGDRVAQTERVMNAIFPEDAMVLFHRVSLEMAFADNFLARQQQNNSQPPRREIIELDAEDDVIMNGVHAAGNEGGNNNVAAGQGCMSNADAPPVLWDVGMNMGEGLGTGAAEGEMSEENDGGLSFWQAVANEAFCGEGMLTGNVNVGAEHAGVVVGENPVGEQGNINGNGVTKEGAIMDGGGSSTGSTTGGSTLGSHQVQMPEDMVLGIGDSCLGTQEGNKNDAADKGKALATEPMPSADNLEPMMKLALCCASKLGGTSQVKEKAPETSSEGSSTEGVC